MGILSWLVMGKSTKKSPVPNGFKENRSSPSSPVQLEFDPPHGSLPQLTFDDIADQLDLHRATAFESQAKLEVTNNKLQSSITEIARLKKANQGLRSENGSLQSNIKRQSADLTKLQGNPKAKELRQVQVDQIVTLNALVQNLDKRYANTVAEYEKLQAYTLYINEKAQDMQLELEFLKCTRPCENDQTRSEPTNDMQLTPQPFVVVLIDGDAYAWAHDIFKTPVIQSPGALAAIRLKNEVIKHIMEGSNIPPSSKVVTRVYINGSGKENNAKKRLSFKSNSHQYELLETFRVQFTEAMPLFDFVDVGHGKERADEKIRENFHLLLANPHCHRVFLAICTDNGFARMLEQYQYHTAAYEKIILVTPGFVVDEIARLGFKQVIWPSVFVRREPMALPVKQRKKEMAEEQARRDMAAHHQRIGLIGKENKRVAELVKDTVKSNWDGKAVLGGPAGRMALKMRVAPPTTDEGGEEDLTAQHCNEDVD